MGCLALKLDDGWHARPRPAHDILHALADVHDEVPDEDHPPAHRTVNIPEPETEEERVELLVAKL